MVGEIRQTDEIYEQAAVITRDNIRKQAQAAGATLEFIHQVLMRWASDQNQGPVALRAIDIILRLQDLYPADRHQITGQIERITDPDERQWIDAIKRRLIEDAR